MDEKLKDQDILFVKEKGDPDLKAVSGIENGELKTAELHPSENNNFLKIDKGGNALENFCSNYMNQVEDPTRFEFFKVPLDYVAKMMAYVEDWLKYPNDPACQKSLDEIRVKPEDFSQKQPSHTIDESRIDWSQLERLGVTRETLEKTKSLDAMLNWQRSPVLLPITTRLEDITLKTDARLSFRETPDGKITLAIHALRKEPELDKPYFGVKFNEEDKLNFQQTGNLGRIANAEYKQGEQTPVYLSVDRLTNELVAVKADRIRIPDEIKGVKLDDQQKKLLQEGKGVYLEGMIAKSGKAFNATVQINADRKGIEFRFNDSPKIQNSQSNRQEQSQKQSQSDKQDYFMPKRLGGVDLLPEQQGKLKEGGTIYVEGMKDKQGQQYNAYVKFNFEEGKPKFYKWNPDSSKAKTVTPDNAGKTQVAVNSEGKTHEATKNVREPLVNGQTKPTEQQKAKEDVKQGDIQKSKGRKLS